MRELLKKHFGYDNFRPMQEDIIKHCVSGKDCLVLMPTGGGKSLCFQIPALKFHGVTVVVSPLIALMKDQVDALRANGISAAFLNSSQTPLETMRVEQLAKREELKLLYLSPERLALASTQEFLQKLRVDLFAIDEAHCISEWGHDFRPEYRMLRSLRRLFPQTPIMALTATANTRVREDILSQLGLRGAKVFQSSFNRPNLTYTVFPKKQAFDRLLREVQSRPNESIIVYCFSRKGTEQVAADLRANGIKAAAYHAGMSPQDRAYVQEQFIRDHVPVIAATIAFGMGIDKPDVRLVVHMDLPKSVEGYYQETGRAGRDGLASECILFFSKGDLYKHELFLREIQDEKELLRARMQLQSIAEYGEIRTCRRGYLLKYFSEPWTMQNCGACDNCVPRVERVVKKQIENAPFDQVLFDQLRSLRRELAESRGVPPYVIFGDRTLQAMSRKFPQRVESLSTIFGVGKEKLAQYGERFLSVIITYAKDHDIREQDIEMPVIRERAQAPVQRAVSETVMTTVRLFERKMTPDQIARAREFAVTTVYNHLEQALDAGISLDSSHLSFSSPERLELIASAFEETQSDMLTPVRVKLGESFSYDEIRFARFLIKARKG
jgi:ATP-dependent DNA helicase RecQ